MTAEIYVPIAPGSDPEAERHRAELLADLYPKPEPKAPRDWDKVNADWLEDILWLVDNGSSVAAICQSMHAKPESIARRLRSHQLHDIAAMFERCA